MSPLDANMLLRDGTVDLDNSEALAVSETRNNDGSIVLDIGKTGANGMIAVMTLPTAPTAAADVLDAAIQASDHVSTDFKSISSYPTLYALVRRLNIEATTAFVEADIGVSATGGSTGDTGTIRWYDKALETIGGVGDLIVQLDAAADTFDDASEVITSGTTGIGTMNRISVLTEYLSYGIYAVRFVTNKRYIRASCTPSGGSNFGKVTIGITNAWNFPLAAQ